MQENQFDCIIVGSGLVGCAVACCLKHLGLRVVLLERHLPPHCLSQDERPITLNRASVNTLKALGLWSSLKGAATPLTEVKVTQQNTLGQLSFHHTELKVPFLGYVVRYHELANVLYQTMQQHVSVMPIEDLVDLQHTDSRVEAIVSTQEGRKTQCASVLLACDGGASVCRDFAGIETNTGPALTAMTMTLTLAEAHNGSAHQRITPQGMLALLPLFSPNEYRLVWTLPRGAADRVSQMTEDELIDTIQALLSGYCPTLLEIKKTGSYPVATVLAKQSVQGRVVLLGSASHQFLPTTAQGFNLSLRNVAALTQLMTEAVGQGKPFVDEALLRRYQQWCTPHQNSLISLTQCIYTGFQLKLPFLSGIRGLGLSAIECLPWLKKRLGQQFLGLHGLVPLLSLGVPLEAQGNERKR